MADIAQIPVPGDLKDTALCEIEAVWARLPPAVRDLALHVPIVLQFLPDEELLRDGMEEDLLGLFVGYPFGTELDSVTDVPPQIYLFLANILSYANETGTSFAEEVVTTYLHELGHFLGWDEDEMEERGLL